ncbi:MAG: acetoin utilization protein AcuC, partial [Rhodospirillaceae bacterium]
DSEFACLLDEAVLPLLERITPKPQVLMIQGGCDALADDPQSRMQLSNGALWRAVDRLCAVVPRVILLGGGGYNPMAVARCWARYWGVINGFDVPERLPAEAEAMLRGLEWQHRRARNAPERLYTTLQDPANEGPIRPEIRALCREVLR